MFVTYDGSAKAAGVKVFINGAAQPVEVFTDKLTQTIRTPVPFKVGQRHTSERLAGVMLQDLRLYDRALTSQDVDQVAKGTRAQWLLAKAAKDRASSEVTELYAWWLAALDQPSRALTGSVGPLREEETVLRSRGTITHVMQERTQEPVAYVLFRGQYDLRRDKVPAATPGSLPPMNADAPRNRLSFARWLLEPEQPLDSARQRQSLLATAIWQRHRPHDWRLWRRRRIAVAPRAARLAGGGVPRVGLGREEALQASNT